MFSIKFKNNTEHEKVWCGMTIMPNECYEPSTTEVHIWSNNLSVLQSLLSGELILNYNGNDVLSPNDAISILKGNLVYTVPLPFANKKIPNLGNLFLRKHGIKKLVPASTLTNINFTIPYDLCKLNKVELFGCSVGDLCNFYVLDSESGLASGVPNKILNQFGFNVNLTNEYFYEQCPYDVELIKGLQIMIEYKNESGFDKVIGINFNLHEIKK